MAELFVLGNASIDVTLRVPSLPRPGETLMANGLARAPGGKGLNQAVVAVRCGVAVHFCAALGSEPETAMVRAALAAEGFASLHLPDPGQPTDLSTLLVADDAENCIVSTGACADALPESEAIDFVSRMTADDILLVQGNLSEPTTFAAVSRAPRAIINTAPLRWNSARVLRHCAVVIANAIEAEQVTGHGDPTEAAPRFGGTIGIVTLGAQGCHVAESGTLRSYPAPEITAVDTTGAGDTFCGALAACLTRGMPLAHAIALAQRAAAWSVARPGCFTALPTREVLAGMMVSPG